MDLALGPISEGPAGTRSSASKCLVADLLPRRRYGLGGHRRWLANAGLVVGADRAGAAGAAAAPVGVSSPARVGPRRDGRDPLGVAYGHAVEPPQPDRRLLLQLPPPPL